MSIAHELSCDVAAAILGEREEGRPDAAADRGLTDVVLEVHATLRRLTREARRGRLNSQFFPASDRPAPDGNGGAAVTGLH